MATFNPSLFESYDDYMSIMDSMGLGQQTSGISLPTSLASMSPQEKAQVYNQLLSQGFSNTDIRSAVEQQLGTQSNANWGALQDIASGLRASGTTGGGALQTAFGDTGSWQFGKGATYQDNMITSQGAYFQRGGDVVVSDELFWNPNSPTGDKLKAKVDQAKAQGQRAGVVITPYAVFQGKVSNEQLINEIKNSGVDFVALDPYLGFGVSKDDLLNWTKDFIPQLNNLGLGVKLVTQDFAKAGMEQETRQYNQELMSLPGVSEFVSFGLEDAPDLQGSPEWVSLSAPTEQAAQVTPKEPERKTAQETPPSGAAEVVSQGLLGTQAQLVPDDVKSQLDAFGPYDPNSEVWYYGGPQIVSGGKIYRKDPSGNIDITVAGGGPGSLQQVVSPTGELLLSTTDTGETSRLMAFMQTALPTIAASALLGPAGTGLFSAPTAAAAGAGGTTLARGGSIEDALKAAAIAGLGAYGTGQVLNTMNQGAYDLSFAAADAAQLANQGLDAAAIAQNLSTYVDPTLASSLANTAANQAFALADANQLVQQGLNTNQVSQVLQASGVDAATAVSLAQAATDGVTQLSPSDIVPDLKFQKTVGTSSQLPTLPDSVTVTGQGVTGDLFNIPVTSVGGLLSAANLPTLPDILQAATQQVQVAGQNQEAQTTAPEAVGGALAAVTPQVPTQQAATQQVQVPGQAAANNVDADTASAVLSNLLGQPVTVQGATQRLDITGQNIGQTITPEVAASLLSAAAGQQVVVQGANIKAPSTAPETVGGLLSSAVASQSVPVEDRTIKNQETAPIIPVTPAEAVVVTGGRVVPVSEAAIPAGAAGAALGVTAPSTATTTTDQSLFKPSDVLKLIGLIGGAGAGSALTGAGTGTGIGVPPSDTMLGTTTPQFGDDYYAAIQRYYNSYMPQYPRDVAGPLQQWYENKFSTGMTTMPVPQTAPIPSVITTPAPAPAPATYVPPTPVQPTVVNTPTVQAPQSITPVNVPSVRPAMVTAAPSSGGLSAAQQSYFNQLVNMPGQGSPSEIYNYVRGLNDFQSLASLATMQGKDWNIEGPSGTAEMDRLSQMYGIPVVNYGQK